MELRSLKLFELKELAKSKGLHDAYKYKKEELILKLIEIETNNIENNNIFKIIRSPFILLKLLPFISSSLSSIKT